MNLFSVEYKPTESCAQFILTHNASLCDYTSCLRFVMSNVCQQIRILRTTSVSFVKAHIRKRLCVPITIALS
jgi:hypothetical protein